MSSDKIYTMHLRKTYNIVAGSRVDAIRESRRVLMELLMDNWFFDADFEVIQVSDTVHDHIMIIQGEEND